MIDATEGGKSTVNRVKRSLTYFETFCLKVLHRNNTVLCAIKLKKNGSYKINLLQILLAL